MTQSVELVLDVASDAAVRQQWARLAEAGLPSEQRSTPSPSHRPHVTLFAAEEITPEADAQLPALFGGLDLEVRIGGLLLFGPRRSSYVLARQVVVDAGLLQLQSEVARLCAAEPDGHFGRGRWIPHVTLARRVPQDQMAEVLAALGSSPDLLASCRSCRRWDSERRVTWELATS